MTPDEISPAAVDAQLLAHMMACDALLNGTGSAMRETSESPPATTREDDRAASRLLLLLRMLEAPEIASDMRGDGGADADRHLAAESRPLLGRFQVLRELGSGGFGFVVHARDLLLGRDVALKMPLPERVLTTGDVHRFLREARAVARLDHPNIVRVFEAGELGPLGYYIASEFCDGPSLKQWLKAQNAPVSAAEAARWLAALADAVQHAHDRGILHRDIKPDNVILAGVSETSGQECRQIKSGTPSSAKGLAPRLTDFGLAKLVDEAGDDTRSGGRIGTPHYMAPEQAAGHRQEIGPATDVYALGATLYEILTGRPPFRGATELETMRLLLDTEAVALKAFRQDLPRDLETICLKCLRKQPALRYPSAAALRADLERLLSGQPIVGRRLSAWERARTWSRRRPAVAVLLGFVVLLSTGLAAGTIWWSDRSHAQRNREALRADRHNYAESLKLARRALDSNQIEQAKKILLGLRAGPERINTTDFAWHYLSRRAHSELSPLWGHDQPIAKSALSPDGRRLATCDAGGKLLLWELGPGMLLDRPRVIRSVPTEHCNRIVFLNDGRLVATLDREGTTHINVFDCASGRPFARLECGEIKLLGGLHVDSETGRLALLAVRPDDNRSVQWWTLGDGKPQHHSWPINEETTFGETPEGGRFIGMTSNGRSWLVDPWTGKRRVEFVGADVNTWEYHGLFSFSGDGRVFASHTLANQIIFWDMDSGRELTRMETPANALKIVLSPRGSHLAILDRRGQLSVRHRSDGQTTVLTAGSGQAVKSFTLSFSSDESLLAMGLETDPGGARPPTVWDIATGSRIAVFPGRSLGASVTFLPGSRSLVLSDGTRPRIWRVDLPPEPDVLDGHRSEAWAAAFSPDGKVLATGSGDGANEQHTIKLWDQSSGKLTAGWTGHTATVGALAFSPEGRTLASASFDSGERAHPNVTLWDPSSHKRLANLEGHTNWVNAVAFSPDGRCLATASDDLTARVWDVSQRKTRFVLAGHTKKLTSIAFSPDGTMLATGSNDATVRVWDFGSGEARTTMHDDGNVLAVAFGPSGSIVASVNEEGAIKFWNPKSGELTRTIRGEADQLCCIAFTPDGLNVAAAGKGKVVRIWDVLTGQELLSLEGHEAQVNALAFSRDGSTLASCDHLGNVKLWRADWPGLPIGR